jgi:ABC-2 type transport system permease protein
VIDTRRVDAILRKEWLDLRGSWAPWLPGLLILPLLALPFVFTLLLPALVDEPLEESDFAEQFDALGRAWPAVLALPRRAAVQAFLFQQFLVMVILVPVTGAMSLAAHSIIGEKQARSLEPLLVTPLSPAELLLAKVLAALAPALVLEVIALMLYFAGIAATADPGVLRVLVSVRSAVLLGLVGPLAALVGLQLVVMTATRARDPRSAQQIGVLLVLPLVGIIVGQSAGAVWLTSGMLIAAGLVLLLTWVGLLWASAALFDREQVITRWR